MFIHLQLLFNQVCVFFLEECCIKNRSYILRLASRPLRVSLSMPLLVYILMKRICSCQRFAYARFTMYIYMCV